MRRDVHPQLAPVEPPPESDPVLERITDSLAREVYRRKAELEIRGEDFIDHQREHTYRERT